MLKSKDGQIEVYYAKSPAELIFPPLAWSIVNIPLDAQESDSFFNSLYQTSSSRHVMLALCRHKRRERYLANKNLPSSNWTYFETVSIWYEKPSTCSNNGFLPLAEPGWLYYKGDVPNAKNTDWFLEEYNNATNIWNVAPQKHEPPEHIFYQKFSWEINLLLMSLSAPLENRKFLYTFVLDKHEQISLFKFCQQYGNVACLYAADLEEANEILGNYSKFLERKR